MKDKITTWQEFKQWIDDNGIITWKISASKTPQNNDLRFQYNKDKSLEENLFICERQLNSNWGRLLYATGWRTTGATGGGFSCEIQMGGDAYFMQGQQPIGNVNMQQPTLNLGGYSSREELYADFKREIKNEMLSERLNEREKEIAERERELKHKEEGTLGLLLHYLSPIADALQNKLAGRIAPAMNGIEAVDGEAPEAPEKITPVEEESPFSDEEADKLMELMERFKKVEPDYIRLIESVVKMAENGDAMYQTAKGFLLK